MNEIHNQIHKDISENDVILFMKGNAEVPQCGFSGIVVQILNKLNITFKAVDVLQDAEIRQAIKEYSNWPTIPQLYIKGEFIGGSDIVREIYSNGELFNILDSKNIKYNKN